LQSGLRILRDLRGQATADKHYIVENNLAPAFVRLCIQSILYVDTSNASVRKEFALTMLALALPEASVPDTFETLEEARNEMSRANSGMFRMFYMCDVDQPYCNQPETFSTFESCSRQLAAWNAAFERFIVTKSKDFTSKEVRGAAMLKIQHMTVSIMVNVAPPDWQDMRPIAKIVCLPERFIPFIPDFQTIVNLARSLVAASEADARNGKPAFTFSTDPGVIGSLYYCCIKCPEPALRWAAMELLARSPRREGMWNSTSMERLIKGYWELEQRHHGLEDMIRQDIGPISLSGLVDLVFEDGWRWRWKLNDMVLESCRATSADFPWAAALVDGSQHSTVESEEGINIDYDKMYNVTSSEYCLLLRHIAARRRW
jgi:hypothetical protein